MQVKCSGNSGIRRCAAPNCPDGSLRGPCCLTCRWRSGRDSTGKPFALRDICPHRAFPLSFGEFDGASVECAYHGWKFDAHTGQCRVIPSLTADSKLKCERIYAGSFPCEERDGYIWVFMSNPEGRATGGGSAACAGTSHFQPEVSDRPPLGGPALQRRPGDHRADGPGARPVRSPGLVVAHRGTASATKPSSSSRYPTAFE